MAIIQSTLRGEPAFVCVVCGEPIEQNRARNKIYCSEKCWRNSPHRRAYRRAYMKSYYERNRERLNTKAKIYQERNKAHVKSYRERHKKEAFLIVGKGKVECAVCGCPYIGMLTVGHYRSNGKAHRDLIGGSGALYRWIIAASSSEIQKWGLQLECYNCNMYHARQGEYPPEELFPKWSQ